MALQAARSFLCRHGTLLFDVAVSIYAAIATTRHVRKALARPPGQLEDLTLDLGVSDFEAFYRCALRMQRGQPMYFPDSPAIQEQPSKQAPFFELLLQPLLPLGAPLAIVVFGIATLAALLHSLRLARGLLAAPPTGHAPGHFAPLLGALLLLPTLHLNFLYFQTAVLLVWMFLLGCRLLPSFPFAAGLAFSVGISIKVIPAVFLVWLIYRRAAVAVAGIAIGLLAANGAVLAYAGWDKGIAAYADFVRMLRADPAFGEYHERYQGLPTLVQASLTPHYRSAIESAAQAHDWNGVRNFLGQSVLAPYRDLIAAAAAGLVVVVAALVCRGSRPTPQRLFREGCLVAVGMLLVSPHTWRHYYWWLWPTAVIAVHDAARRRVWAVATIAVLAAADLIAHRGLIGWPAVVFQVFHGPAVAATAVFALLASELRRDRQPRVSTPSG